MTLREQEEFKLFKRHYRDRRSGQKAKTSRWYLEFYDHLHIRRRWPAYVSQRQSFKLGETIVGLVATRRNGEPLTVKQTQFLESAADELLKRLIAAEVIDRRHGLRGGLLLPYLEGSRDEKGKLIVAGFQQALEARDNSASHVSLTIGRTKRIIEACSFLTVADMRRPAAVTEILVFLGNLRKTKEINGSTFNKHVQAISSFCNWLVEDGRLPSNPLAKLKKVTNTETDAETRRELSVEELRWLCDITLKENKERFGLSAAERERLYRFAFATGMRPGQIRALVKSSFNLDADPPVVTAAAATVKRRRIHTQVLTPEMAGELKELFKAKVPTAPAFRMPSKWTLAEMVQKDLADARTAWIGEAKDDVEEQLKRQQSEFLADVDHQGARFDFYSLRHSHGSALAEAGAPQSAIQASLHHTTSRTTERYIHTRAKGLAAALGKLPSVKSARLAIPAIATGTYGAAAEPTAAPTTRPVATSGDLDQKTAPIIDGGISQETDQFIPGGGNRTRTGITPQRILSPLADSQKHRKNQGISQGDAPVEPTAAPNPASVPPDLAEIIAAWPTLREAVRRVILATVRGNRSP